MANVIPNGCNQEAIYVPAPDPCSGGCVLETLNVTEDGTYTPPSGVDGFDNVIVEVGDSAYTFCKAIESDGLAYIDTGYAPQPDTWAETVFSYERLDRNSFIFGARTTLNVDEFSAYYELEGNDRGFHIRLNDTIRPTSSSTSFGTTSLHELNMLKNNTPDRYACVNDTIARASLAYVGTNYPLYLFALNNQGGASSISVARMYSFIIGDSSGVQMNLVPCIRNSDSKVGMYDVISGTFFGSADPNGVFTAITS